MKKNYQKLDLNLAISKITLDQEKLEFYGSDQAKINNYQLASSSSNKAKIILVTAITPTPAGEGKTTTAITLHDAFHALGVKSVLTLREPSMGPVFGRKGGATGGKKAKVIPEEKINLHFTGDIHAISTANNLIAATIDNHIFWGNKLKIKDVWWKRCLDINDRSLRKITINKNKQEIVTSFDISAASEIMAIFCLAKDIEDLIKRLNAIIIGINFNQEPVYLVSLKITNALIKILQEAFKPNLVQTLEHNPVIMHGGPFANIAHGCNSLQATNLATNLADFVITEAGFGADLGAEKFINIKTRVGQLDLDNVVLVATIRALKFQGNQPLNDLTEENVEALARGLKNLEHHIQILKSLNLHFVIALNVVESDSNKELTFFENWVTNNNYPFAFNYGYSQGSKGAEQLAKVVMATSKKEQISYTYQTSDSLVNKIEKIATKIYRASGVNYSAKAQQMIDWLNKNNLDQKYICVAKIPNNITDSNFKDGYNKKWSLTVDNITLSNGADLIVVHCGKILTMPGLPSVPRAEKMLYEKKI